MAKADRQTGQDLLKKIYGSEASFREGQWEAIHEVAIERRRLLVVQRTGWERALFISYQPECYETMEEAPHCSSVR